jgi:tryptophan synthase alpha chain
MGYLNPVIQYGVERFCKKAAEVGADGVIIPDLPLYEYESLYAPYFKANNLSNIFMVTPQTSAGRIQQIDSLSDSFIYLLSASIITGSSIQQSDNVEDYYKRVKAMKLHNPGIFGFGVNDKQTFDRACSYGRGAIIGSRFVKLLGEENYLEKIPGFISGIKS